jgi:serine/threonine protein phosphatase PrpC
MKPGRSMLMFSASVRCYRMLLLSYPPEFRAIFAQEMTQTFRDCCRQAIAERGGQGLASLWSLTLYDLVVTAAAERVRTLLTSVKQLLGISSASIIATEGSLLMFNLTIAQQTDIGRTRQSNEDSMLSYVPEDSQVAARKGALFVVSDGLGGHTSGEIASAMAAQVVRERYYQDVNEDIGASLQSAIKQANRAIVERAAQNEAWSGMGTTVVAAVLRDDTVYAANVGDSRVYIVRGDTIRQITEDHSWVMQQIRAGQLTPEEARDHPKRNVIYRCLGTDKDVEVDLFTEQVQEGDLLVLCTDGLSGQVSDDELLAAVQQYPPEESVQHLIARANENGGPDNITAIVVQVALEKEAAQV